MIPHLIIAATVLLLINFREFFLDPDLGWHLLGGQWILDNNSIPTTDFINTNNSFWHDYHWLAQIILYKIYSFGGLLGLKIFSGCILISTFYFCYKICRNYSDKRWEIQFTLILCLTLSAWLADNRPQTIVLLPIAISYWLMCSNKIRTAPFVFLLSVLAANIHVYWIIIPFLWLLFKTLPEILTKRKASSTLIFVAILASGLFTPYSFIELPGRGTDILINYKLLINYLNLPSEILTKIAEQRPFLLAAYGSFIYWFFLVIVMLFVRTINTSLIKNNYSEAFVFVIFLILSIKNSKQIPLLESSQFRSC